MTDKEKILKYIEYKGINKNKFYNKTGLSVGFLDSGNSLGVDKLKQILDNYHDLNIEWFFNDNAPMIKNEEIGTTESVENDIVNITPDVERKLLIKSVKNMTETADRNSKTIEKIVDLLCSQGVDSINITNKKGGSSGENRDENDKSYKTAAG